MAVSFRLEVTRESLIDKHDTPLAEDTTPELSTHSHKTSREVVLEFYTIKGAYLIFILQLGYLLSHHIVAVACRLEKFPLFREL